MIANGTREQLYERVLSFLNLEKYRSVKLLNNLLMKNLKEKWKLVN